MEGKRCLAQSVGGRDEQWGGEMSDVFPNGLTDVQLAARFEPFVGMVGYIPTESGTDGTWTRLENENQLKHYKYFRTYRFWLLAGEPGCPWPPPVKFRHSWKRGDRAWLLVTKSRLGQTYQWRKATVVSGAYSYLRDDTPNSFDLDAPAIYIPESEK